jgi:hypothetical protein
MVSLIYSINSRTNVYMTYGQIICVVLYIQGLRIQIGKFLPDPEKRRKLPRFFSFSFQHKICIGCMYKYHSVITNKIFPALASRIKIRIPDPVHDKPEPQWQAG